MSSFIIKVRRTIIEAYEIEATSEAEARRKAEEWDHDSAGLETDQEDWELLSVKEDK